MCDAFVVFAVALSYLSRLIDQACKERPAGRTDLETTLRMPLNAQNELFCGWMFHVERRIVCIHLDRFDDAILRGTGHDAKTCARRRHGLVMARIDGKAQKSVHLRRFVLR